MSGLHGSPPRLPPVKMRAALGLVMAPAETPNRPWAIRRRMLSSLTRVLTGRIRRKPFGVLHTDRPLQWIGLGSSYVLSDREGHFFLRYSYSKSETWRLLKLTLIVICDYARTRGTASQAWKAAQSDLFSMKSWRALLGPARPRRLNARSIADCTSRRGLLTYWRPARLSRSRQGRPQLRHWRFAISKRRSVCRR